MRRRYLKIFLLAALCMCLLQAVSWLPLGWRTPIASAHAFVIGSDPIDGSTIDKAPTMVRIYFDAPVAATSQASVYAFPPDAPANGVLVNASQSVVNPGNSSELDTPLLAANKLPQGGYEVRWTALSLTDGRTTSGLIGFNLGASSLGVAGTPTLGPSTSNYFPQLDLQGVLSIAWDWLVLLALLFWIGILLTDYFILPRSASATFLGQVRKHSRSLQALCLLALFVGELINLVLRATSFTQTLGSGGVSLDTVLPFALSTNYGRLWLVREILLLAALLFHWFSGTRSQTARNAPASGQAGTSFSQLRQQARPESGQQMSITSLTAIPTFMRSQARVTGAVASVSPSRGSSSSLPRITTNFALSEAPAQEPATWQKVSWLTLAGLILLTLVLSNELLNLAPLPISAGIFSWLSLAAQAAWFGPLAYLGLVLLPMLPAADPDRHAETLVTILKRTLPWLLAAPAVLLVSEMFLSEATLQTPAQLLDDPYGRALLIRALLLLTMLVFTAYTLFFLLPSLQRQTVLLPVVDAEMPAKRARKCALEKTERTVKRALNTLAALATVTVICLALMNFFAPPVVFPNMDYHAQTNQPAPNGTPVPVSQNQQTGDLSVKLQVQPARVGVSNTVTLTLTDTQGRPVNDATVKLRINMQIMDMGEASASVHSNGSSYSATFRAGQTFSMAGAWIIQVEIDRPQHAPAHATFHILVAQ